ASSRGGRQRRLLLRLDPIAYQQDKERTDKGKPDVLESINLLVRRQGRENNFKFILDSIKHLALSDVPAPQWLQEVFLGYSDPAAATYQRLPNRLNSIDYRDTFLDWQHLVESLPGKNVEPDTKLNSSFPPPYVLETTATPPPEARPSKRRKREPVEAAQGPAVETVKVGTYKPANPGPYPVDAPKLNSVRFTPTQIEAITSGTQPGLTVIV
ncbi:P-loop containing nucleoside triphosphate hydrolase protein, partial [Aureobasidium melanogenum]